MPGPLTDADRWPLLDDRGRRLLTRLLEHPAAPRYNFRVGERLRTAGLANVRAYADRLKSERTGWRPGEPPAWLPAFVRRCRTLVPFHRRRDDWSDAFYDLPSIDRDHVRPEPWSFVPDDLPLDDVVVYTTTGTTGSRLEYFAHPEVPNRYLPLIETALAAFGVRLDGGDRVSVVHVAAQKATLTYASVLSYLGGAGFAKVNLADAEWRRPSDAVAFLDDCDPELYTGDPFAFSVLAELPLRTRPKALVSMATALLPGLRRRLEERFGCPVVDVYSTNESGPVAFGRGGGHEVLPPDLFVEVLDEADRPCPPGTRGEVTLTGGVNPYLPLLRYRTGDFAALDFGGPLPRLVGLEGRAPVTFRTADGRWLNSIDVTSTLAPLPLPWLRLHQSADGSLTLRARGDAATLAVAEAALRGLFGAALALTVAAAQDGEAWAGKAVSYTSDLAHPEG
jgi:phenylacetate-CoA ligase